MLPKFSDESVRSTVLDCLQTPGLPTSVEVRLANLIGLRMNSSYRSQPNDDHVYAVATAMADYLNAIDVESSEGTWELGHLCEMILQLMLSDNPDSPTATFGSHEYHTIADARDSIVNMYR